MSLNRLKDIVLRAAKKKEQLAKQLSTQAVTLSPTEKTKKPTEDESGKLESMAR
jgi:hypothetical protein